MGKSENKSSKWDSLVWIAIIALVGIFAYIAIPNFIKARSTSAQNPCINNLRQIEGAKNELALETGKTNGAVVEVNQLTNYLYRGVMPKCPQGGIYTIGKVGENPTCSLGATVTSAHVLP